MGCGCKDKNKSTMNDAMKAMKKKLKALAEVHVATIQKMRVPPTIEELLVDISSVPADKVEIKTAIKRITVCVGCDFHNPQIGKCTECGCYIGAKVQIKAQNCPIHKW